MITYEETDSYFVHTAEGMPTMGFMHYHQSYELYYLEAGNREYFVEDRFYNVSSGDFVLIAPSKFHRTGSGYSIRTIIGFTDDFLSKTFTPPAQKHIVKCFDKVVISPPEEQQAEFKALVKSFSPKMNTIDFSVNLGYLLQKLSQCTPDTSYDKRISSALKYINQNFSTIDSIDQIAEQLHISKHYLCRLFKDSMGITLIDYLNTIKIKNACTLLETSNKDILEISQLCGYNSSAYFSNIFKKMINQSPSEYRKKYRHK